MSDMPESKIDVFKHTQRVVIELSNLCNYAMIHTMCPAHLVKEPKIQSSTVVYKILGELGEAGYSGHISFYGYSEPTIDPRLFDFIGYGSNDGVCPNATYTLTSNGYYLTTGLLIEYYNAGLRRIRISGYTDSEYSRLCAIKKRIADGGYDDFTIRVDRMGEGKWRERISLYTDPHNNDNKPCYAPLVDIRITVDGKVGLCCVDYLNTVTFGDARNTPLCDIVTGVEMQQAYRDLSTQKRTFDVCKRCTFCRKSGRI